MTILNFLLTLLILFIILGTIITIHEFGHFIAAKKNGVYVSEFSLGMGPLIFEHKPKKSETTYSLRLLPIGGYVAMAEKEEKGSNIKKDRVLENKSFLAKVWVMINGIVFNCLLAMALFFISGLIYGRPISDPIIAGVTEGGAAEKAGIEAGDKILYINGVKISTWDDFTLEAVAKKLRDNYTFKVEKTNGDIVEYNLVPEVTKVDGEESRVYGIKIDTSMHKKGFIEAIKYMFTGFGDNFRVIINILKSLFVGQVSVNNLSGPVGIYSVIDTIKAYGLEKLLYITAYLSINVGIVNLIPIPVFDGGRIFILIIEKIIRRKTSEKLENILNYIGFGLMILLMLLVTYNDIFRLMGK